MTLNEFLKMVNVRISDIVCYEGNDALAAVEQDGYALRYVKEQTPEICLAAVEQDGYALQYVKEQTAEICLAAVKKYGEALQYVKEQTAEICLAAVKQNGYALQYVDKKVFKKELEIRFCQYCGNKLVEGK